ncbi:MAG: N-acetylmuramoyl-L-alanine amidase [Acidimicrobiia bacterium]|nr:N-acetylmuramoyl-L-alanine amidase [Acidimicrobiia bacterium]
MMYVRTVAPFFLTLLLVAGCAGERPMLLERSEVEASGMMTESSVLGDSAVNTDPVVIIDEGEGNEAPAVTTTTPSLPATAEGTLTTPRGGVRALISPTGVLVPVTGEADNGYLVTTPCGNGAFLGWGQPLLQTRVVIDPGHGGDEEGAVADNGLTEAALNLRVARRAASELAARGISVALTRTADYRMPITQRAAVADALGAEAFVSIHHNTPAAAPSDKPGTEVYVQVDSAESRRLGGLIYEDVIAGLDRFDMAWVARSDAGVLAVVNGAGEDAYGINRHPTVPSALIEVAYLGNPLEARLMESDQYVATVGRSIADGIEQFLATADPGSGFVEQNRVFDPSGSTGGEDGCVDPPLE